MEKGLCGYCDKLVISIGYQGVFHNAIIHENHFECARTLLREKKADANKEHNNFYPLYDAATHLNMKGVHFLLTDAKVDVKNRSGVWQLTALSGLLLTDDVSSLKNRIATMLIDYGTPFDKGVSYPEFFQCYYAQLAACRMAQRSLERVLKKTKVISKDLVPLLITMVWETRADARWKLK